jgi:hypothetical protein
MTYSRELNRMKRTVHHSGILAHQFLAYFSYTEKIEEAREIALLLLYVYP